MVGVPRRSVISAVLRELGFVLGGTAVAGLAAGTLAQYVVLRTVTLGYVESITTPALIAASTRSGWRPAAALAALLFGAVALASAGSPCAAPAGRRCARARADAGEAARERRLGSKHAAAAHRPHPGQPPAGLRLPQRLHHHDRVGSRAPSRPCWIQGDGGVGTTYRNISKFLGRESELTYTVTELPRRGTFALRGENKTVTAHDTMSAQGRRGRHRGDLHGRLRVQGRREAPRPAARAGAQEAG